MNRTLSGFVPLPDVAAAHLAMAAFYHGGVRDIILAMEEQNETSQPRTVNSAIVNQTPTATSTAADILKLKDERVKELTAQMDDHQHEIDVIKAELRQLGAIGGSAGTASPARKPVSSDVSMLGTNGKRGRGRPAGVKNKPKEKKEKKDKAE